MTEVIPLSVPNISGNEGAYLQACVESTFVSSVGEFVDRFEAEVARACDAAFAVATASGTAGLHAALHVLGLGPGDHAIVPSYTFVATANAVSHCGAQPVIVDISPEDWCLSPDLVTAFLEERCRRDTSGTLRCIATGGAVKAIVPVYAMGLPARMDAFRAIADRFGLALVADAAAAIGARHRGQAIGRCPADLTMLSFNGNKLVTSGGGGAIIGQDPALGRRLKHVTTTARVGPGYDHDAVGFNFRMTNLEAAVGVAQMERLDEFVAAKARIAAAYREAVAPLDGVEPFPSVPWAESVHWLSGIHLRGAEPGRMAALRAALMDAGIEARPFWKPLHHLPPYADAPRFLDGTADALWGRIQPLPCSTHLTATEQAQVIEVLTELLAR